MFPSPAPARARSTASFVSFAFSLSAFGVSAVMSACARGDDAASPSLTTDASASPCRTAACGREDASPSTALTAPTASAAASLAPPGDDAGDDGSSPGDDASLDDGDEGNDADDATTLQFAGAAGNLPGPGDLAITEIMLAPSGTEPDSEWFEVYNRTSAPSLLNGLTLEDGFLDTHVIASSAPIVVPPLSYVVLVRDRATALQALIPDAAIVYEYGTGLPDTEGIELDAGDAGDLSLWNGTTLLADVPYGMWDAEFIGQSIELETPGSTSTDVNSWCVAQTPWAPNSDDGTPGGANDCLP